MSMENGFELDFPGDDDNADRFGSRAEIPGTAGVIGEPDATSIDEMPRLITQIENPELVLSGEARPLVPAENYWQTTDTHISWVPGNDTYKLSFITRTDRGSDVETVRLTQDEALRTWRVIGEYFGLVPR